MLRNPTIKRLDVSNAPKKEYFTKDGKKSKRTVSVHLIVMISSVLLVMSIISGKESHT